jgi:hypothetical protein
MDASRATGIAQLVAVVVAAVAVTVLLGAPTGNRDITITKTTTSPDGKVTVEKTVKPADDSALEKSLSRNGDLLIRIGLVAVVAFLGGAVTQRILLGKFAFKAGSVELPEVADAVASSDATIAQMSAALAEQGDFLQQVSETAASALRFAAEALARQERP